MKATNSGRPPEQDESQPTPTSEKRPDGQYKDHWVLSAEERAKGFVRPVRKSYVHVGIAGPEFDLVDLTPEQVEMFGSEYAKYEPYPEGHKGSAEGRFWTQEQLDKVGKGCGSVTSMPIAIAETYAASPGYYGSTFCAHCGKYFPVGARGEFIWAFQENEERVGT